MGNLLFHASDEEYWEITRKINRGEKFITIMLKNAIFCLTISYRIIELLLKFGKSSFLRKQESSSFKTFWIPACAGMTKWGYFSKLSILDSVS